MGIDEVVGAREAAVALAGAATVLRPALIADTKPAARTARSRARGVASNVVTTLCLANQLFFVVRAVARWEVPRFDEKVTVGASSSPTQNCQSVGVGPHAGSGCQSGPGCQPGGGVGQLGGLLYVRAIVGPCRRGAT